VSSELDRALVNIGLAGGPVKPAPHPDGAREDRTYWDVAFPAGPERIPTVVEQPMTYLVSCPGTPAEDALIAGALMADARVRGCAVDVYEYINLQDREPFEVTLTPRPGAHGVRHSQAHGRDHHLPTAVANAWLAMFGRGA